MINLIKTEITKIRKKKSFLIITIIYILFAIFTNTIYKDMNNYLNVTENIDIISLKEDNKNLDLNNEKELEEYASNLATIEAEELKENKNDNQKYLIEEYILPLLNTRNEQKYIYKNIIEEEKLNNDIKNNKEKILENNW